MIRGPPAVVDGLGGVARPGALEVVVGEFGQQLVAPARLRLRLQGYGDPLVQPLAPDRCQLRKQRLPHQRMVEAVPATGLFDDDARLAGFLEGIHQVVLDDPFDEIDREPATDDRGGPECLVGSLGETGQPAAHRFPHTLRERTRIPAPATLVDVPQRLDEEEGVATRHRRQRPRQLLVVVAGRGDVRGHLLLTEPGKLKPVRGSIAIEVGQHRREWMRPVEIGAAVRAEDLHTGVFAEPEQMPQQQQRRLGGPVEVVEHQHHRSARGGGCQHGDDRVEQRVALGVRIRTRRRGQFGQRLAERGHQRQQGLDAPQPPQPVGPHARHQRPQRFGERLVRRTEVLVAPAVQHDDPLPVGPLRPFPRQAGLSDPGLACDQHGTRAGGQGERPSRHEALQLAAPADERSASGEYRGQGGSFHGRVVDVGGGVAVHGIQQSQLEHALRPCEVLELTGAQVVEHHVVGQCIDDQLGRRARAEDLPTRRHRPQPRGAVDRPAEVVAVAELDLAGVQRHPHGDRVGGRPWLLPHRLLQFDRRRGRCRRPVEDRERGIALTAGLDEPAAAERDHLLDDLVVPCERRRHGFGIPLPRGGRALDVGEQEGHGAGDRRMMLRSRHFERRILRDDGRFEPAQVLPRVDAQLIGEQRPSPLEGRQRLGLPARAVQREHQVPPAPFAQWRVGDGRFEFADELGGPARRQQRVGAVLHQGGVLLDPPGPLGLPAPAVGQLRSTAPQRHRLVETGHRVDGDARVHRIPSLRCGHPIARRVHVTAGQDPAGPPRHHEAVAEGPA